MEILLHPKSNIKFIEQKNIVDVRIIAVTVKISNKFLTLVNTYLSNKDDPSTFSKLHSFK